MSWEYRLWHIDRFNQNSLCFLLPNRTCNHSCSPQLPILILSRKGKVFGNNNRSRAYFTLWGGWSPGSLTKRRHSGQEVRPSDESYTHSTQRCTVHARTPRDWWSSINWSPINVLTSRQFYCIIHCSEGDGDGDGRGLCVGLCVCCKDPPQNTILRKRKNEGVKAWCVWCARITPQIVLENSPNITKYLFQLSWLKEISNLHKTALLM